MIVLCNVILHCNWSGLMTCVCSGTQWFLLRLQRYLVGFTEYWTLDMWCTVLFIYASCIFWSLFLALY